MGSLVRAQAMAAASVRAKLGRGLVIKPRVWIKYPWRLVVGNHCWIGQGVGIDNLVDVRIGSHVCLSQQVYLCTGSHDYRRRSFDLITQPIEIGDGAWLGVRALVLPGVTVGANAIAAGGSVVVKDVPCRDHCRRSTGQGLACFPVAMRTRSAGSTILKAERMRSINFRFAALLLALGGVLAAVGYPLHAFQLKRNARMFLREAERAQQEHNNGEALRYLFRYLQLVPDNVNGLSKAGLLLAEMSDTDPAANQPAYEWLEKALRLTPGGGDPKQLRRHLVLLAIKLGRYTDAEEHLVRHLLVSSPEDPKLLLLWSQVQEGLGRYAEAAATLEKVLKTAPSRPEVYAHLAALLRGRLERPKDADAVIEKLLADHADACRAHVLAGAYFRETARGEERSRIEQAREHAATALRISPDDAVAIDLAVRCAIDVKDYGQARRLATRALEHNRRFGDMYILLANVEVEEQHRGAALACLQEAVAANPHDLNVALALASLLLDEKKVNDAAKVVGQLKAAQCPDRLLALLRRGCSSPGGSGCRPAAPSRKSVPS